MKKTELTQELKQMRNEIHAIRLNMVDKDMILSQDDFNALAETANEKKAGKLIRINKIFK